MNVNDQDRQCIPCVAARFIALDRLAEDFDGAINRAATHGGIFPMVVVTLHHRAATIFQIFVTQEFKSMDCLA
jgi:hypothetical protein